MYKMTVPGRNFHQFNGVGGGRGAAQDKEKMLHLLPLLSKETNKEKKIVRFTPFSKKCCAFDHPHPNLPPTNKTDMESIWFTARMNSVSTYQIPVLDSSFLFQYTGLKRFVNFVSYKVTLSYFFLQLDFPRKLNDCHRASFECIFPQNLQI